MVISLKQNCDDKLKQLITPLKDYHFYKRNESPIGQGEYGTIYLVCDNSHRCNYIVKIIEVDKLSHILKEIDMQNKFASIKLSPNILDAWICDETDNPTVFIVMEKKDITLKDYLREVYKVGSSINNYLFDEDDNLINFLQDMKDQSFFNMFVMKHLLNKFILRMYLNKVIFILDNISSQEDDILDGRKIFNIILENIKQDLYVETIKKMSIAHSNSLYHNDLHFENIMLDIVTDENKDEDEDVGYWKNLEFIDFGKSVDDINKADFLETEKSIKMTFDMLMKNLAFSKQKEVKAPKKQKPKSKQRSYSPLRFENDDESPLKKPKSLFNNFDEEDNEKDVIKGKLRFGNDVSDPVGASIVFSKFQEDEEEEFPLSRKKLFN